MIIPTFVNSVKLKDIPSRLSAPTPIMVTAPLKGVVAPPRFVPRINADHTAGVPNPATPPIIGEKVSAIAILLTVVLARPLNHKVAILAPNWVCPNVWKSCVDMSLKINELSRPPTTNMKPAIKKIVSQSSFLKISVGSEPLRAKARTAQPKATASAPTPRFSRVKKRATKKNEDKNGTVKQFLVFYALPRIIVRQLFFLAKS